MTMGTRSITLDVWVEDQNHVPAIRASVARYRAACRKMFAALACAQATGATITGDRLTPQRNHASAALALLAQATEVKAKVGNRGEGTRYTIHSGKAAGYSMRKWFFSELYPDAKPFVFDSARRQVWARWAALDPEFPKASRGWLILQGARGVAEFRWVGIELPQATAKPLMAERSITLNWDHTIGPVQFQLGTLDPWRWQTWTQIRDGSRHAGTVILNARDGKLRINVAYEVPDAHSALDAARCLRVSWDGIRLVLDGPEGSDTIEATEVLSHLATLLVRRKRWENCRRACGNPKRPWGNRKAWKHSQEHLSRATNQRERFVTDSNHAWSRRVTSRAAQWNCGTVAWSLPAESVLCEHPWAWRQFQDQLRYKLTEIGCSLTIESGNPELQATHTT